jgi:hypothetical protein
MTRYDLSTIQAIADVFRITLAEAAAGLARLAAVAPGSAVIPPVALALKLYGAK